MQVNRCRWARAFLAWAAVAVAGVAPAAGPTPSAPQTPPTATAGSPGADPAASARQRIDRLVGTAACRRDSDCATLPLPDQACGGPRGWIAYSSTQTDREALAQALAALPPDPPGTLSTCLWRPDPGAVCRGATPAGAAGRCTLRAHGVEHPSPR